MNRFATILFTSVLLLSAGLAHAQDKGRVTCQVTENGQSASGTMDILDSRNNKVGGAACGSPVAVPPGNYTAVLSLDGALDGPQLRKPIQVQAGETREVTGDFATATVEIRIEADGRRAAGMAVIRKDGQQIGTLGSGVSAHISAGTYEIVARYRSQEKSLGEVTLKAGERKELVADF